MRTIYDIGMHNGDDTAYYLQKGYRVVAVEANPTLCASALERFAPFVEDGRLTILNKAIADKAGSIEFFINTRNSELSSIVRPLVMDEWALHRIESVEIASVIPPDAEFAKIDIEGADLLALDGLDRAGHCPASLSCEAHSIKILCKLILMGYDRFRIVNAKAARKTFRKWRIRTLEGERIRYGFSKRCSGPFGDDLPGDWYDAEQIVHLWSGRILLYGGGWFDIHAKRSEGEAA